jgi:hypothetical protein
LFEMTVKQTLLIAGALIAASSAAIAQAPPAPATPPAQTAPAASARAGSNCAPTQTTAQGNIAPRGTTGQSNEPLGDKLAKSDGVLCPPSGVDPEMHAPTPNAGESNTPVIPPPGSPGGDQSVRPK